MLPLLADHARSECARSMRAVGRTCTHSAVIEVEEEERPLIKAAFLFWKLYFLPELDCPDWLPPLSRTSAIPPHTIPPSAPLRISKISSILPALQ